ncbi:MAG: hypothetical protein KA140_03245 [Caldisericia bacterium]|nr:hypothetical protein [Caldisericia bacterium]
MKKIVQTILLVAMLSFNATPALMEDTKVNIVNPGFESDLSGWTETKLPPDNKKITFETAGQGRSGSYSAKITSSGKGIGLLSQEFDAGQWSSVHIEGYIKTSIKNGSAFIDCSMLEGKPAKPPYPKCTPEIVGDNDWTLVEGDFSLTSQTKKIKIGLTLMGEGWAMFDDISITASEGESSRYEEFWVENPQSGIKLCVHQYKPKNFDQNKKYPAIIMLPGGNGFGTQLEQGGLPEKVASQVEAITIVFDPDGRGQTKEGTDDISGPIHQAGLNEITKYVSMQPFVDAGNIGYYTMSFGIIMGACAAGRYPNDPPVKFILDWEGPDGHLCPINHVGRYDMDFWGEREASEFIKNFPGIYIRLQTEKDHVQKTNDHALRMINGATAKEFGGQGKAVFTRVNMKDGQYSNPPNTVYASDKPPVWFPESMDRQLDDSAMTVLKELVAMEYKQTDPLPPGTNEGIGKQPNNRLGFLNPYGYPKYSQEATNSYFKALKVNNAKEYASKVRQEMTGLNPGVMRTDFFMFAGDQWKQMLTGIDLSNIRQTRIIGTLDFKEPGIPAQTGTRVSQVVEYFDGDGEGDNPSGVVIKDWQIENEINMGKTFWNGTPEEYATHLENCYKAAKLTDPDCRVVLAGEACDKKNDVYPKMLKALDGKKVFDAVDIHIYADDSEVSAVENAASKFKGYLKDAGFDDSIPMWMTEYGIKSVKHDTTLEDSQLKQAGAFAARTIQAAALNLEGSCYISIVDVYSEPTLTGTFDVMGLVASGLSTKETCWTKRPVYWTYARMSELMFQILFGKVEKKELFGDAICSYSFDRIDQGKLIFMYVQNPKSLPTETTGIFTQPFVYSPLVANNEREIAGMHPWIIVSPGDRQKVSAFFKDIANGPVVINVGGLPTLASKFGINAELPLDCTESGKCTQYADSSAIQELGTSWMIVKPTISEELEKSLSQTDKVVEGFKQRMLNPVMDITNLGSVNQEDYLKLAGAIAKRYSSTTTSVTKFILSSKADTTPEDFAQKVVQISQTLKRNNKDSELIVTGENDYDWWAKFFKVYGNGNAIKDKKPFETFGLPSFRSAWSDKDKNYKARQKEIESYLQLLAENGLGSIKIASPCIGTRFDNPENMTIDDEKKMAAELARMYAISLAGRSSLVGWDGTSASSSLFNSKGEKRLAYWTLSMISQSLSTIRTAGRVKPGDDEFGSKLYDKTANGLWMTRFGGGAQSCIIGWLDGDKPPQFATQDYDLPFSSSLELEYLIPESVEDGKPVFKKVVISQKDGIFTIPSDRFDPFIIKPTPEMAEPFIIAVNPPELNIDPGTKTSVMLKILGCSGSVSLSIPSTSMIAIQANASEPDDKNEITLTVAVSKEAKGTKTTVNITAICDNGQQSSTQLTVNVSNKVSTKITLWVGQKKAKIDDQDYELSVAPTIINGKTLVPVRFISEAFGAKVEWEAKEQRIELIFGLLADGSYTKKVTLWVGKKTAQSDFGSSLPAFREYTLDVAPTIISGTTMVPIRFISDVLGAKITWDDKEKRIDIVWSPI